MLNFTISEKPDFYEISVSGEVDMFNASTLKNIVLPSDSRTVILNCEKLDYIDSTGLGAMVNILKKAKQKGGNVKITGLKPQIYKLFALTELDTIFDIEVAK